LFSGIDRGALVEFQRKHYSPANIVVSAAGLVDHDLLEKRVAGIFGRKDPGSPNVFAGVREAQDKPRLKIFHKATEQTHMALGFHGLRRDHPLRHAQALLHVILGGNMSSRLFNEVRESRGLAYEIGTLTKRYRDTGAFVVHAGIDNVKWSLPGVILKDLGRTKSRLVTDGEFKRAKDSISGS
jgi:predicted Zn-dependent peptidase